MSNIYLFHFYSASQTRLWFTLTLYMYHFIHTILSVYHFVCILILFVPSCPYHFVHTILSIYHFVCILILSVPFCPILFCPYPILSIPFCPRTHQSMLMPLSLFELASGIELSY